MQRRQFLLTGTALAGCSALRYRPDRAPAPLDEHELDTIAAIADTFLPGDDGTPGAHEANALATIVDPAYGLAPYLSELVGDLDQWCLASKLRTFVALPAGDRERALEQRMGLHHEALQSMYRPAYEALLALTKLAYFGGLHGALGPSFAAFPGASRGWAPASAGGAWASRDRPLALVRGAASQIVVEGAGNATAIRVSGFATTDRITARLVLHAPDGRHHAIAVAGTGDVHIAADATAVRGARANGTWRLEVAAITGVARLELWSLVVRTDLDDAA